MQNHADWDIMHVEVKLMKNSKYRPRVIDSQIEEYLSTFGAVCIEGPKWCGKIGRASCRERV